MNALSAFGNYVSPFVTARSFTPTLADRVRAAGVPVIPMDEIKAHKRQMARDSRVGIWRWLHPLPRLYVYVAENPLVFIMFFVMLLVAGGHLGAYVGDLVGAHSTIAGTAGVAAAGVALACWFNLTSPYKGDRLWYLNFLNSGQYWTRTWREASDLTSNKQPHIERRVKTLDRRLGSSARFFIERFGRDPLIAVVLDGEIVYFGAWETGTDLDRY